MQLIDVLVLRRIKGIGNKAQMALIDCYREKNLNSLEDLLKLDISQTSTAKRAVKLLDDFFANNLYEATKVECEKMCNDNGV